MTPEAKEHLRQIAKHYAESKRVYLHQILVLKIELIDREDQLKKAMKRECAAKVEALEYHLRHIIDQNQNTWHFENRLRRLSDYIKKLDQEIENGIRNKKRLRLKLHSLGGCKINCCYS